MVRTIKFLIALAVVACASTAYADPPARIGRLNFVAGTVSFAPGEAPDDWVQSQLNRPLTSGDRLWADRDGRAEFHVGPTAVRIGAYTALDFLNLDDERLQLRLAQGDLNVRVRELDRDEVIEIATPNGAVLLRQPGSYRVTADPQRDFARVAVQFGQAEVVTPGQTFVVPSSQAALVPGGAPPRFEVLAYASADEFDRWSADRDHREDRVDSARYVSRDMTGYEDLDQYGTWRSYPEYGNVWIPSNVPAGWAPYRQGHWAWVSPWGWTWIDDAPWGFAPFHYGRWVWLDRYWAWAPGPVGRRPVYAPALVGFIGGSGWSVSVSSGPSVGWFPLGWREPYIPWYRATPRYVQNVNVAHVTNVTNITNVTKVRYVYRDRADAVTVVPQRTFVSARPVWQEQQRVRREELARAQVVRERPPVEPVRASFAPESPGRRPPTEVRTREVVAVSPPAQRVREVPDARDRRGVQQRAAEADVPRVRVLPRERAEVGRSTVPQQAEGDSGVAERMRQRRQGPGADDVERAREQAQERARAQSEQRQREGERRGQPLQQDSARAQSDAAARAQADAQVRAHAEAQARAQADAQARAQTEQRQRERQQRAQQDNARAQQEAARARNEAAARAHAEQNARRERGEQGPRGPQHAQSAPVQAQAQGPRVQGPPAQQGGNEDGRRSQRQPRGID